jgi:hypothetical protein
MKDLNLDLNLNEVNAVLRALSNLPYTQVHLLIDKIQEQARAQLGQGNGISHNTEQDLKNN